MLGVPIVSFLGNALRVTLMVSLSLSLLASSIPAAAQSEPGTPRLVEIRAAHHTGYDRIVFEFEGPPPDVARARWVPKVRLDPSNLPAYVQGNAFIRVVFRPATAHEDAVLQASASAVPQADDPTPPTSASAVPQADDPTVPASASAAPHGDDPTPTATASVAPPGDETPPAVAVPEIAPQGGPSADGTTFGPARRAYDLPNIAHVVMLGDYEGSVSFGIGLMARTRIMRTTMLRDPSRFVLDVSSRFPKGNVKVYFADEEAIAAGDLPPVRAVRRKVPRGLRAEAALQRLYAGPTAAERARGLRLVASGTTGFRALRINDGGVARVALRGPCNSMGSAIITIADQVRATLKARPSIDWVKIYDRDGQTTFPWGRRDSNPFCLEP